MAYLTALRAGGEEEAATDVGEISICELRKQDRVLIRTANSSYRFAVVEPTLRQGVLTGGRLGDSPCRAVLVVSMFDGGGLIEELTGLKIGARAVFYLVTLDGMERLITSAVTGLTHVRSGNGKSLAS